MEVFKKINVLLKNIIFVFNDFIGVEFFDEIVYSLWKENENNLEVCLKKIKFLVLCRKYILSD